MNEEELNLFIKNTNSMLNDDVKLLNIVKQILIERNVDYEVPMSFDTIDGSILAQIVTIDSLQQKRIISRDLALELIADLFESLGTIQRFEKYCNEVLLKKYKELFFKYKTKFEDLLFELNVGRINQKEFFKKYKELIAWRSKSLTEINNLEESLSKHKRKK